MQLATKKGSGFNIKGSKPFRCSVPCPFSLQQNARHFSHLCSVPLTLVERHGRILADTKILPLIPFEKNFSEHVSDAFPSWFFCSSFGAVLPATQKMNGRVPSEDQHTQRRLWIRGLGEERGVLLLPYRVSLSFRCIPSVSYHPRRPPCLIGHHFLFFLCPSPLTNRLEIPQCVVRHARSRQSRPNR